jgi:hypothetical protein
MQEDIFAIDSKFIQVLCLVLLAIFILHHRTVSGQHLTPALEVKEEQSRIVRWKQARE